MPQSFIFALKRGMLSSHFNFRFRGCVYWKL